MGLDSTFSKVRQIGYFRKVNFLVKCFENIKGMQIENCVPIMISKKDVEELLNRCIKVLANHSLAEALLPTQEGFFFGNTDYNDYYFKDVKSVKDYVKDTLLPEFDKLDSDESIQFKIWY